MLHSLSLCPSMSETRNRNASIAAASDHICTILCGTNSLAALKAFSCLLTAFFFVMSFSGWKSWQYCSIRTLSTTDDSRSATTARGTNFSEPVLLKNVRKDSSLSCLSDCSQDTLPIIPELFFILSTTDYSFIILGITFASLLIICTPIQKHTVWSLVNMCILNFMLENFFFI